MTKTNKIIYAVLGAIIVGLVAYALIIQPKVNAGAELMDAKAQIEILKQQVDNAKAKYDAAVIWKEKCIETWENKKIKAHSEAEYARAQIEALEGFILGR